MRNDNRVEEILDLKQILPYLNEVNYYLFKIYDSLISGIDYSNSDDNFYSKEEIYSHWIYEIKYNLDFIASSLTDEFGNRFGGYCLDGFVNRLLALYEDSLQIPNKSIQEKIILELLIKVCLEIIVNNGDGINNRENSSFALNNTRKFLNHLVKEHEENNYCREKIIWFDLNQSNYINSQE